MDSCETMLCCSIRIIFTKRKKVLWGGTKGLLSAAVALSMSLGAVLPTYAATPTMPVTSDLTHTIAGSSFLLGPDGQPIQITGDGDAEKASTVVIMGSLNGVKLSGKPFDGVASSIVGQVTIRKTPMQL